MPTIPRNLRLPDLVAKTARVTLKDTMRVMLALDATAYLYGTTPTGIATGCDYTPSRPTPDNVAACEQASFELREGDTPSRADIDTRLTTLQTLL